MIFSHTMFDLFWNAGEKFRFYLPQFALLISIVTESHEIPLKLAFYATNAINKIAKKGQQRHP